MINKETDIKNAAQNAQEGGENAREGLKAPKEKNSSIKKTSAAKGGNSGAKGGEKKKNAASDRKRNPDGTFAKGNDFSDKYQDKYADDLIAFFSRPLTKVEYRREFDKDGNLISETPIEIMGEFPTMGTFAMSIGVSVSALKTWAGVTEDGKYKHERFAKAYQRAKEWAGGLMEAGALSGKLNANMAKFVLTNDYGKEERQVIESNVSGISERDLALIKRVGARIAAVSAEGDNGEEG